MVQAAENDRQERHNVRNRAQAQLVHKIVLQNEIANLKRARNLRDEDKLEERQLKKPLLERLKQTEKKASGTSSTTKDFVEVSTRKKERTKKKKQTGEENEGTQRIQAFRARKKGRWLILS